MAIFYVYVNVTRISESPTRPGYAQQLLLTCESRYVADELFRKLQTERKLFPSIVRTTPQFWCLDTPDGSQPPSMIFISVLRSKAFLSEFRCTVMPKCLGDATHSDLDWPIIPVVHGPDWLHNGTYFIRNKRRPERYWYFSGCYVCVSDTKMSKFQIRGVGFAKDESKVLIRSDRVQILPLGSMIGRFLNGKANRCDLLQASSKPQEWKFSELFSGFKETESGDQQLLKWATGNDGDSWELC